MQPSHFQPIIATGLLALRWHNGETVGRMGTGGAEIIPVFFEHVIARSPSCAVELAPTLAAPREPSRRFHDWIARCARDSCVCTDRIWMILVVGDTHCGPVRQIFKR